MKKLLLKILMIDDKTLIYKARLFGRIYLILAFLLAVFIGVMVIWIKGMATDIQETYETHIPAFKNSAVILTDDTACKTIVCYASMCSSIIGDTALVVAGFGVSIISMIVGFGIIHIRYHQILNKLNSNQGMDLTR